MPTYVYLCQTCNLEFDVEQRITADVGADCPTCHERSTQRLIAGTSFSLKGDGWASDLYAKKPKDD